MTARHLHNFATAGELADYGQFQKLYLDAQGWPIPDTEIRVGGEVALRINALGCKGPALAPGVPVVLYLGDSTTFGITASSWPAQVRIGGCQMLNAAVEGHNLERLRQRYDVLQPRVRPAGVVVYAGWHNIIYGPRNPEYWEQTISHLEGDHVLALATIATCLRPECRERGYPPANLPPIRVNQVPDDYFAFWPPRTGTSTDIAAILDGIARYNDWVRDFTARRGHVLLDLYTLLLPPQWEMMAVDFFDVCHLRASAYPRMAAYVGAQLHAPVRARIAAGTDPGTVAQTALTNTGNHPAIKPSTSFRPGSSTLLRPGGTASLTKSFPDSETTPATPKSHESQPYIYPLW